MTTWNISGPDPTGAGDSEADQEADHEAVRTAEQAVSDAWIGRLLVAESEADAVLGACARVRQRAADRVRAAQRAGDLAELARSQSDLELADAGWGRAIAARDHVGEQLARELATWSESTAHRVRQRLSDRSGTRHR